MSEELNLDYKKALEVFKDTMREGNYLLSVKSALEKQIPKKVQVEKYDIGGNDYFCPCCTEKSKGQYCSNCGQALDWSDTE